MSNSTYEDWLNARDNARKAIQDVETEGARLARSEAAYYRAKATDYAALMAAGNATSAGNMVKGADETNAALEEFRMAQATYKAATLAANLFIDEEAHCYDQHKRVMAGDSERF